MPHSALSRLHATCWHPLSGLFDTVVQRVNGCVHGSTPFDYPAPREPGVVEPSTCCSRASWVYRMHYVSAFALDLLGCLPFDLALDRLASFLCLTIGLAVFENDPGWTSLFSKGWLVTSSAGYGASCLKSWLGRSAQRAARQQQRAADDAPGEPALELQQPHVRRQHVLSVRPGAEEQDEQLLLLQSAPDQLRTEVAVFRALMLYSVPRQHLPALEHTYDIVERRLHKAALGRFDIAIRHYPTIDAFLYAVARSRFLIVVLVSRIVSEQESTGDIVSSFVIERGATGTTWPNLLPVERVCRELTEWNELHDETPVQCIICMEPHECDDHTTVRRLLQAVDFCITFRMTRHELDVAGQEEPPPWLYVNLFAAKFFDECMQGQRIDVAVAAAQRETPLLTDGWVCKFQLYACATDIVRPLYSVDGLRAPERIAGSRRNICILH